MKVVFPAPFGPARRTRVGMVVGYPQGEACGEDLHPDVESKRDRRYASGDRAP